MAFKRHGQGVRLVRLYQVALGVVRIFRVESVGTRAVLNPSEVLSGVVPGLPDLRRSLCSLVGYVLTMIPVFIPELRRDTFLAALSSSPSTESFMVQCNSRIVQVGYLVYLPRG